MLNFLLLIGKSIDPQYILENGGIGILIILVYLETAFFLGILLPGGESLVFAAGLLVGTGFISTKIFLLIILLVIASTAGDFTGFFIGRKLGRKLFEKRNKKFFTVKHLERAQSFYNEYGNITILLGKFIPIIRPLIPAISGAVKMPAWQFAILSLISSLVWVNTFLLSAYFLGQKFPQLHNYIGFIIPLTIIIALIPALRIILKNRKNKSLHKNSRN